ncbi:MAG: hypothetical protein HY961_14270 [Ignavibacteriae bacterium]|nr:hypothetical protein [Ignavibacteriota bacterium]
MSTASNILRNLGYSDEQALRDFAHLQASQKHAELNLEASFFEQKYKMSFSQFEAMLKSRAEENFDNEDDYLAWKFAHDGVKYWKAQLDSLRRTS